MIKQAIENEKSANSVKITKGLANIKDFNGVTGKITIDSKHDATKPIAVEHLNNGKVVGSTQIK